MKKELDAGHQLSSQELHFFQQRQRLPANGPVVVAYQISDLFNLASIFRCAEAIGVSQLICVDTQVSINIPKLRRLSRHSSEHLDSRFLSLAEFLHLIPTLPPLIALEVTSQSTDIFTSTYPQEDSWVVGGETTGISPELLAVCQMAVHIPMVGLNSSHNVAQALCVALYDWHRRYR